MGIYNVVHRDEKRNILVNCNHRHNSLVAAIHCVDAYLIAGLATQVETADRDQLRHGLAVDPATVDTIREAMYGATLHARNRRGERLVQEVRQEYHAPDR